MTTSHPPDLWELAKQIDGYPETECSFPVFSARVATLGGHTPRVYYEQASSFEDVVDMLRINSLFGTGVEPTRYAYTMGLGVEWFESGFHAPAGRLQLPDRSDRFLGRHCVAAMGFDLVADELLILNPWTEWGDGGRGAVPRRYFEAHVDEVFVQRSLAVGPSPAFDDYLLTTGDAGRSPKPEALLTAWLTPNPEYLEAVNIDRGDLELATSTTASFDGDVVDVLELRELGRRGGRRERRAALRISRRLGPRRTAPELRAGIARCHVQHTRDGNSLITELFVMPGYRRRGYGSFLEARAAQFALDAGSTTISVLVYEGDARPRVLPAALAFLRAHDYVCTPVELRRPNLRCIATRNI